MITAAEAKQFVTSYDDSVQIRIMDAIINALYNGRLHAELVDADLTEGEIQYLRDHGYTVHITSETIYIYWS